MVESTEDTQLKQALQSHLRETEVDAARVKEILGRLTDDPSPFKCKTVGSLLDASEEMIEESASESARDTGMIAVAQRIEHYELAAYEAVWHYAKVLGLGMDAKALNETTQEENDAARLLTGIAQRINPLALKST